MVAGYHDRERAVALLRDHYVGGRLTVEELSRRTERVLGARSSRQIRRALAGLPVLQVRVREAAEVALHGVLVAVFTAAYLVFSFVLLLVLGLTLVIHGASTTALVAFLVVWLVPTYLLSRLWRHAPRRLGR
jgi:DUF1707 SHOCT-like domain